MYEYDASKMTYQQAALCEPFTIGLQANWRGDVRPGDVVLVHGGGPIGLIEEGDTIEINIPEASIHLAVSDEELARRKAAYVQPEPNVKSGWLARYARMVASANLGAVMQ